MNIAPCRGNDPYCPCQDGDLCHYRPIPGSLAAELERLDGDLRTIAAEASKPFKPFVWWLQRRLARIDRNVTQQRDRALTRYFRS